MTFTPQAHAFEQMQKIAAPIIKSYHNDLNEHDRRVIESAEIPQSFLWAPRECGTHLITLTRPGGMTNLAALDHFRAIEKDANWYLIAIHQQGAIVRHVGKNAAKIVEDIDDLAKTGPNFYALHM